MFRNYLRQWNRLWVSGETKSVKLMAMMGYYFRER